MLSRTPFRKSMETQHMLALRVIPAETRLTVYRRLHIHSWQWRTLPGTDFLGCTYRTRLSGSAKRQSRLFRTEVSSQPWMRSVVGAPKGADITTGIQHRMTKQDQIDMNRKIWCEALSSSQGTLRGLRRSLGRILPSDPRFCVVLLSLMA